MRQVRVAGLTALILIAGLLAGAPAFGSVTTGGVTGPQIRLIVAQHVLDVPRAGKRVEVDPGIWVAALGGALRIDVGRVSYIRPVTIRQVITSAGVTRTRRMPAWMNAGSGRLRDFGRVTVRNSRGRVVGSRLFNFCPNNQQPAQTSPAAARTSAFPEGCFGSAFQLGTVAGIARGWAVDPAGVSAGGPFIFDLPLGTYHVTETIQPGYTRFFGIPARDATATVIAHVVKGNPSPFGTARARPAAGLAHPAAGLAHPAIAAARPVRSRDVPLLRHVPADALPDLVALPSSGISVAHVRRTGQDLLDFGATVWVGGHSPLDVEGFRTAGRPTMTAYQYFFHDGRLVGRTRAGTMGFDDDLHWQFKEFARYALLNASRKIVLRDRKVGFCIGPSDPIDLLLPHAAWKVPGAFSAVGNLCGQPSALSVTERVPLGWGDTYTPGDGDEQAMNITHLPDGTYYIEITVNPEHLLHEVTTANDTSLRKIIITGTPGHRHVRVPAFHGIDPEG